MGEILKSPATPTSSIKGGALRPFNHMKWIPIEKAKTDGRKYLLYAPPAEGLEELFSIASYHPDAGWCIDEFREATLALELIKPTDRDNL